MVVIENLEERKEKMVMQDHNVLYYDVGKELFLTKKN
jgi:hypothetical protein